MGFWYSFNIVYICIYVDDIGKEISFGYECSDIYLLFIDNWGRIFVGFGFGIFFIVNGFLEKGYIFGWSFENYMIWYFIVVVFYLFLFCIYF